MTRMRFWACGSVSRARLAERSSSCDIEALRVMEQTRACAYWRYGPVSPSKDVMASMLKV